MSESEAAPAATLEENYGLAKTLELHAKWLRGDKDGVLANLDGANLTWANLTRANLYGANLTRANLTWANLTRANLTWASLDGANLDGANLTRANLTRANLDAANLTHIKQDLILAILCLPDEIPFLREALIGGRVDGSTYEGECACLAGTMCHAKKMEFDEFEAAKLMPIDSQSPRERWFYGISEGDTPETSPVAMITLVWIDEALSLVERIRRPLASVSTQ